jgi:hypothetical protein
MFLHLIALVNYVSGTTLPLPLLNVGANLRPAVDKEACAAWCLRAAGPTPDLSVETPLSGLRYPIILLVEQTYFLYSCGTYVLQTYPTG